MPGIFRKSLLACCAIAPMIFLALPAKPHAATDDDADTPTAAEIREHYTKHEYRIPMRDGTKLFTAVYIPKDTIAVLPLPDRSHALQRRSLWCRPLPKAPRPFTRFPS